MSYCYSSRNPTRVNNFTPHSCCYSPLLTEHTPLNSQLYSEFLCKSSQAVKKCEWWPRNSCDSRLMGEISIQVSSLKFRTWHQIPLNCYYQNFCYHHSYFFAATFEFTSFLHHGFVGPHTFLQLGCFCNL